MGISIQQWRATIGQWSDGRPGKCVAVANAIARKRQQGFHMWFRLLVLASLLVIGCVELNPGPSTAKETSATPQHGETLPKYKKRPGSVSLHGELYGPRVASYLFARGLNKTKDFNLASNIDGAAGVFDDLVFRYKLEEQDIWKTCFIQLKHKSRDYKVQRTSLKQLSGDFSLFKYFESYCEIKRNVCTDRNLKLCGPFVEFEFVIYTNAKLESNSVVKLNDRNPVSILGSGSNCDEFTTFDENRDKDIFDFFQELSKYYDFISELGHLLKGGACVNRDMLNRIEIFRNSITSAEISGKLDNLKREPSVVEKFMKELDKCDFSLCTEFLQKVKIFQCQSNEKSLETLIKKELREACQTPDLANNIIYKMFEEGLIKWWERKGAAEWLNKRSRVWQNVKESLIEKIKLEAKAELEETQGYGIRFNEQHIKRLSDAIQHSSFLNIITDTNVGSISKLKTHEALNSIRCKNSLFISLKSLKRRKEILNMWPCKWSTTVLVIDCIRGSDSVDKNVAKFLLENLGKTHIKLILISQSKCQNFVSYLRQNLGDTSKYDEYPDDYNFLDLDNESQKQVLERTVNFQGTEVALKELVGNDPDENMKRNIDSHVISLLLGSEQKLNVGKKLGDLSDYYVPRSLCHQIYLNDDILRTTDNTIAFAITGLKAHLLKNYVPPGEKICSFEFDRSKNSSFFKVINDFTTSGFSAELGDKKKRHNIWNLSKPEDVRFIILGRKHPESDFSELKALYSKVHWVQMKDGSFLWRGSNCDIGVIRRHIDKTKYEQYSSRNIMEHRDNVFLLAAEPGMGKSTFLSFMEHEMKKFNPSIWVLRLNLHEYTCALEDIEFERECIDKCENFLWNAAHSPEQVGLKLIEMIFRQALEQTGNMVVILDGFDEISPDYSCKVEKLIRELTDRLKSKVWVSSRFSYRMKLENIMTRFAFTLRPFTQNNQVSFLEQYWSKKIKRPKRDNLRDFAQELLRLSSRNFSDRDGQFTGIPLQTMMLGEAFMKEAENYCSSGRVNLPENFNLLALFKKFTDKKCEIYLREKNSMDCSTPKAKKDKMFYINKHKISALMSLFSSDELNQLLEQGNANDLRSTAEFLQSGEAEQYGIITEYMDSKPRFIHRCFAEYFAAKWFAENFARHKNFIFNNIFSSTFEVVRNIFDRILAEDLHLHGAVLNNDKEAVNDLLKKETDVNCVDMGGRTALHLAAAYNRAVTQTLLSVPGADINATDRALKWTPLRYADRMRSWMAIDFLLQAGGNADDAVYTIKHINHQEWGQAALWECAQKGYKKVLELMLNSGTDINALVRVRENLQEESTLLHIASRYGQVEIVRFLLERSADINIRSAQNNTAMHFAAVKNGVDVITLLLDTGASANVTNTQGYTPLHLSAQSGNLEATKTLVKRRAALDKTNKMGDTPLMLAAYNGRLEIVRFLTQNGSDINLCVADKSALLLATEGGHLDVICFLLENDADINGRNVPWGSTPLQIATFKQNLPVVKCIIGRGADVNVCSRGEVSVSALHVAASVGNWEILDYLIRADADLNIRDHKGQSPLYYALACNKTELAIRLIKRGADINTPDSELLTPLHYAVHSDNLECTKCLVQFGANINHQGPRNITALSAAIELERVFIINVLVENNADINLRDDLGNTALHMAVGKGNPSLVHYLIDRGADINIPNCTGNSPLHWIFVNGWDILAEHSLYARWSQLVLPMHMQRIQILVHKVFT